MVKILLILFTFMHSAHPFYLGVTDLKYSPKEQALQGSVKLFVNDLESALSKIHKKTVDLIHVKDSVYINQLLKDYLNSHLQLSLNGKPRQFNFIGFEKEEEAVWMYIEFKNCELPRNIKIQNSLLFDYLNDQTNIVHMEVNGERKSLKANHPDKNFLFEF